MAIDPTPYVPYAILFFAGFVGAATRGITWQPTSKLIQDLAGIGLIVILVNYVGGVITVKGQAAMIGACCFVGAQKAVGILVNQIPLLKGLLDASKAGNP